MTKEQGRKTAEARDRVNGLKIEEEGQIKLKTEIIDETTRKNESGSQRQKEWPKER